MGTPGRHKIWTNGNSDDAMMISDHKKTERALKSVLQLAIAVSLDAVSLIVLIADDTEKKSSTF